MLVRRLVVSALAFGSLVWVPTAADAQTKMVMSGKHKMYCCDTPPFQFFVQPADGTLGVYAGVPGLAKISATVSATGPSNDKTLLIKEGRVGVHAYETMGTPGDPIFISLTTMLDWYNAKATLAPGGSWPTGYAGSQWSFCPAAVGPGEPGSGCAAASLASPGNNGRIVRKAGPNKFGGTMAMIGGSKTRLKRYLKAVGSPTYFLAYLFVPNSPIGTYPAKGSVIMNPAYINTFAMTPNQKFKAYVTQSFKGAGPWGTGYAAVQVTKNAPGGLPLVTWANTGYDARTTVTTMKGGMTYTQKGVGNLQLVSGILFNGLGLTPSSVTLGNTITVALPEPEPALGIAATAGALALVGLFGSRRRS